MIQTFRRPDVFNLCRSDDNLKPWWQQLHSGLAEPKNCHFILIDASQAISNKCALLLIQEIRNIFSAYKVNSAIEAVSVKLTMQNHLNTSHFNLTTPGSTLLLIFPTRSLSPTRSWNVFRTIHSIHNKRLAGCWAALILGWLHFFNGIHPNPRKSCRAHYRKFLLVIFSKSINQFN